MASRSIIGAIFLLGQNAVLRVVSCASSRDLRGHQRCVRVVTYVSVKSGSFAMQWVVLCFVRELWLVSLVLVCVCVCVGVC